MEVLPSYTGSSFDLYSGDFYALSRGQHYDEGNGNAYEAPGNGNELGFTNLNAGETSTGTLVFDLPRPHGKIAYSPNYEGGPLCYWKF